MKPEQDLRFIQNRFFFRLPRSRSLVTTSIQVNSLVFTFNHSTWLLKFVEKHARSYKGATSWRLNDLVLKHQREDWSEYSKKESHCQTAEEPEQLIPTLSSWISFSFSTFRGTYFWFLWTGMAILTNQILLAHSTTLAFHYPFFQVNYRSVGMTKIINKQTK